MSSLGPEDDDVDDSASKSGSHVHDSDDATSNAQTAEDFNSREGRAAAGSAERSSTNDSEGSRGKRADRKLRESALDDSGRSEKNAPMESLAHSLEYLQEMLEELNSQRVMMSQSNDDPTHAAANDKMHLMMNDKLNLDPGEVTAFINQNWMAILSWEKENELCRDCFSGSKEVGTGALKHLE